MNGWKRFAGLCDPSKLLGEYICSLGVICP